VPGCQLAFLSIFILLNFLLICFHVIKILLQESIFMECQIEFNEKRIELPGKFGEAMPDTLKAVRGLTGMCYREGVISVKMKRLMSLALALGAGCTNCVLGQVTLALEAGATTEEILETLSVVVSLRGTTGMAESLRIIQLLEEMGKL
jgi:AhpD family alkylhydroperoxidase